MDGEEGGNTHKRACGIVAQALRANDNYRKFRASTRKMMKLVRFMQKKFHGRFVAKHTKAELIDDLWLTLLSDVRKKATDSGTEGSTRMLELCAVIEAVPPEIRKYVLGRYQAQMQKLSWIYFYHTRQEVRGEVCDHEEIGLQIFKLRDWLKDDLTKSKDKDFLTDETLLLSEISDADLREFGLLESLEALQKSRDSNINSFHEIGWIDPFPKLALSQMKKGRWGKLAKGAKAAAKRKAEAAKAQKAAEETATEAKAMALDYLEALDEPGMMKPILSLALPSRILLFKIMRACIAVKRKEDLWMYVGP